MQYEKMEKVLDTLNKKWGLDFVSATAGDCCSSCSTFETVEKDIAFDEAETYLVIKWFYAGINYDGEFEDYNHLYIGYNLGNVVSIEDVCSSLRISLEGYYEVVEPEDETDCIELIKINLN